MKGCICHFKKWQIHPFIAKGTKTCEPTATYTQVTYSASWQEKIHVSNQNRHNRIRWANISQQWTTDGNWSFVVLSDECKLMDVRRIGWNLNPDAMPFWLNRNVTVMVWGCISMNGVGNLVVVDENLN